MAINSKVHATPGETNMISASPLSPVTAGSSDAHLGLLDKVRKVGGHVSHARGKATPKSRGSRYK